jgi:hypothetical protein
LIAVTGSRLKSGVVVPIDGGRFGVGSNGEDRGVRVP